MAWTPDAVTSLMTSAHVAVGKAALTLGTARALELMQPPRLIDEADDLIE